MVAAGDALGPERPWGGAGRACAVGSLMLLASRAPFVAVEPFPLGAGASQAGLFITLTSLALGLALGWGVPGLSLALLTDPRLRGPALLGRAFGLGVGYLVITGLGWAVVTGHAPGRVGLLILLTVPPAGLLLKTRRARNGSNGSQGEAILTGTVIAIVALTAIAWPKLSREGLNGDGTEAYEIARSLESHPLQRWDLERWEGTPRFGTPAVNPMVTYAYLAWSGMAILGRGELAARLPIVPAVVIAAAVAGGLSLRPGRSGWAYVAAVAGLYLLWSAYYVGYEPPFTDLAEPAATDLLMVALWMAGLAEVAAGVLGLGVGFLILAAGVLYSAPVLTVPALVYYGLAERRWRPLVLWCGAGALAAGAALAYGAATGDLADWVRQVRSEYWYDLTDQTRRTSTPPFAGRLLLLTGGLPALAVFRWRRLSAPARALLCSAGVYLAITLASSYKNLHYMAPLPFLLAPAALQASGARARAAATAVVAGAFALSWPDTTAIHRESVEVGERSCIAGLGYEEASLAGDVVYRAFAPTGQGERFAVGKHTFVRYALERGGRECLFRLSRSAEDGWIPVAGDGAVLAVRDPDAYAQWRLRQPPVPSSPLFPSPPRKTLSPAPEAWPAAIALGAAPGSALVIEDFDPRDRTAPRARLLLPMPAVPATGARLALHVPHPAVRLETMMNGRPGAAIDVPVDAPEANLPESGWRRGWNVLEMRSRPGGLVLDEIRTGPRP